MEVMGYYQWIQVELIIIKSMLSRPIRNLLRPLLAQSPKQGINHIKNMNEENLRVKAQQEFEKPTLLNTDRVYKPTYTIEFNREGEALLYSADPLKHEVVYFKYPYIFYESLIPMGILNYVLNPFDLLWYWNSFFLYFTPFVLCPRMWFWRDFAFHPNRLYLLRGGRVLKVESQSVGNHRFIYWMETQFMRPLTEDKMRFDDRDNADFLTEQGQLKYDLTVELQEFKFWGTNMNDQQVHFHKYGIVHHPQMFEAACKGYNIDTTDFVINTADNLRYREANYNQ